MAMTLEQAKEIAWQILNSSKDANKSKKEPLIHVELFPAVLGPGSSGPGVKLEIGDVHADHIQMNGELNGVPVNARLFFRDIPIYAAIRQIMLEEGNVLEEDYDHN